MNEPGKLLRIEIEKALRLYEVLGQFCLDDPECGRLLRDLRELIRMTDSSMAQSGVVAACTKCAAKTGSCCFREMGESYGLMGLFVNLLLGSEVPEKPDFPGSCHFVGENGCRLLARQSFCLNYFCPELEKFLGGETVLRIQQLVGKQLLTGWELERALTRCLAYAGRKEHNGRSSSQSGSLGRSR